MDAACTIIANKSAGNMYKLVILIEPLENQSLFEEEWSQFLRWAEQMPGLRREVTSRVSQVLFGENPCMLIHELHFDSPKIARVALASLQGVRAGKTLQKITQGRVTLYLADHLEDSLENIRTMTQKRDEKPTPPNATSSDENDQNERV